MKKLHVTLQDLIDEGAETEEEQETEKRREMRRGMREEGK